MKRCTLGNRGARGWCRVPPATSSSCLRWLDSPTSSLALWAEAPGCPISWGRRRFSALRRSRLSQPFLAPAARAHADIKELHPHLGSQLAPCSQTQRRGREWGVGSCQVSPVLFQNLPETCQTGMSWLLGPFGQVMTFWTLVPLYVEEKEIAIHSSILAWRIPWTGEPGGLPSMRSHRVGHNWSDLAAAAEAAEHIPC